MCGLGLQSHSVPYGMDRWMSQELSLLSCGRETEQLTPAPGAGIQRPEQGASAQQALLLPPWSEPFTSPCGHQLPLSLSFSCPQPVLRSDRGVLKSFPSCIVLLSQSQSRGPSLLYCLSEVLSCCPPGSLHSRHTSPQHIDILWPQDLCTGYLCCQERSSPTSTKDNFPTTSISLSAVSNCLIQSGCPCFLGNFSSSTFCLAPTLQQCHLLVLQLSTSSLKARIDFICLFVA
jgi:hypothetical protein